MSTECADQTSNQEPSADESELEQTEAEVVHEENEARIVQEVIEGPPTVVPRW